MASPLPSLCRILIVEDDAAMQKALRAALPKEFVVVPVFNGKDARQQLERSVFDLILLDLSLPDEDGMGLCSWIRASENHESTPLIFITGRFATDEKVTAFSLGADDYLVKPFDLREFRARVMAKLRKARDTAKSEQIFCKGNIKFLIPAQRVVVEVSEGQPESLDTTPLEFRLLLLLARHEERVFTRDELLATLWGDEVNVLHRTVDSHISDLRKKLRSASHTIKAVRGVGYHLVSV